MLRRAQLPGLLVEIAGKARKIVLSRQQLGEMVALIQISNQLRVRL